MHKSILISLTFYAHVQALTLTSHQNIALSLLPTPLCWVWEGSRLSTWECGVPYVTTTGTLMMPMWFVGRYVGTSYVLH